MKDEHAIFNGVDITDYEHGNDAAIADGDGHLGDD